MEIEAYHILKSSESRPFDIPAHAILTRTSRGTLRVPIPLLKQRPRRPFHQTLRHREVHHHCILLPSRTP